MTGHERRKPRHSGRHDYAGLERSLKAQSFVPIARSEPANIVEISRLANAEKRAALRDMVAALLREHTGTIALRSWNLLDVRNAGARLVPQQNTKDVAARYPFFGTRPHEVHRQVIQDALVAVPGAHEIKRAKVTAAQVTGALPASTGKYPSNRDCAVALVFEDASLMDEQHAAVAALENLYDISLNLPQVCYELAGVHRRSMKDEEYRGRYAVMQKVADDVGAALMGNTITLLPVAIQHYEYNPETGIVRHVMLPDQP